MSKQDGSERNWVLAWAAAIVLLASVPYLWGMHFTPHGYRFLGLTHNIDDGAVYLSWAQQAADGHFFQRNLFTNAPQSGLQVNILFLLMGWFARLTHLSCLAAYHVFRVVLGIGLLFAISRFAAPSLSERRERLLLIPLVGLSSGIGWLIPHVKPMVGSVDMWQPEAITFLSIYLNPLFLAGLILMLGSFHYLLLAQSTGRARYAAYAGLCLFLLGNIHSYDVLTVACVWGIYNLQFAIYNLRLALRSWAMSGIAAVIAVPSLAYQYWIYAIDPVYRLRANTPISSPSILSFIEGFGLVLILAIAGAAANWKLKIENRKCLLLVWAVVGFALPYVPIAQQRKLVMGLQIPLCILAAMAISRLMGRLGPVYRICLAAGIIMLMFQSNARFLSQDIGLLSEGRTVTHYAAYMSQSQLKAVEYVRRHARPSDTVFCSPQMALFVPAFADRQVYYGHWSETPDYREKLIEWFRFASTFAPVGYKMSILDHTGADWVIFDSPEQAAELSATGRLLKAADCEETSVYKVSGRLDR